jgi:hypothetical protein
VPAGFDGWFARACWKNPMERFGSAAELATTLHAILMPGVAMDVSARLPASLGETAPAAAPSAAPAKAPGAPLPGPSAAPAPSAPAAGPAAPVKPRSAEDQAAEVLGI